MEAIIFSLEYQVYQDARIQIMKKSRNRRADREMGLHKKSRVSF